MASGISKFKFISPGVFINEIDRSQLPNIPTALGPIIIGRTAKGPGLRPVAVSSFEEFVRVFGEPDPGSDGNDNWRSNNFDGPTYASYAAQAWLASGQAPVTMVRLLGTQHRAGWELDAIPNPQPSNNGGAFGLFLIDSSSTNQDQTGALAAVWYMTGSSMSLTGTYAFASASHVSTGAACALIKSSGTSSEFTALIRDTSNAVTDRITFNFSRSSDRYIRKVFNTNPSQTNSSIVASASAKNYWLGETYDQFLSSQIDESAAGNVYGVILALYSGSNGPGDWDDHRVGFQDAETPYIRSQDLGDSSSFSLDAQQQLFKLVSRGYGEWANNNIKVSVENLRAADYPDIDPYGTFSVVLRHVRDTDNAPQYLERFDRCNLNPNSENYIARKIGDKYLQWDPTQRRLREYGDYVNNSDFVRVVVHENVANAGAPAELLPFGYFGPPKYRSFAAVSTGDSGSFGPNPVQSAGSYNLYLTASSIVFGGAGSFANVASGSRLPDGGDFIIGTTDDVEQNWTGSYDFPSIRLRLSASDGGMSNPTDAYFGIQTTQTPASLRFDESYYDLVRPLSPIGGTATFATTGFTENSFAFTMDDVVSGSGRSAGYMYASGSRVAGNSATAGGTYKTLLDAGYDQFTVPLFGGFDGLNIREKEPFRNTLLTSGDQFTNYSLNSVKRAVDTVRDPEVVQANMMTIPGVWAPVLTDHLRSVCEDRGDALAIMDIEHSYTPATEGNAYLTPSDQAPDVAQAISTLRARNINSSYACTFFPWVQIRDTLSGRLIPVPASVAALGTFGTSQARTELWFAPAGFVRGGLSNGAAGIPVTGVKYRLTSKNRDDLYSSNINPIATFPNEGIVIFGQKTLQITPSALDRINVRRLMIFIKKRVSTIANSILFEPNVQVTWDRFTGAVEPFLADVKARFGLTDFRVVLDKSTTTDDLIDRNILYAKIYLKPARSIEFIALDFIITRSGASFDD